MAVKLRVFQHTLQAVARMYERQFINLLGLKHSAQFNRNATTDNGLGMSEPKPVLIYDGHCGFCRIWLDYWRQLTGDRIEYLASQDVGDRFPQIPPEAYSQSVQLVRPDGSVASGARAVFESLGKSRIYSWISAPSELAYRIIARHRDFFYHVTRFTFGTRIEPTRFAATQWLFLRALALIYAVAFGSLTSRS